jgi:broad specificity phosphatase PhoE
MTQQRGSVTAADAGALYTGGPIVVAAAEPSRRLTHLMIRHGQSEWNQDGRWQGHGDPPLTLLGEEQALAAVECLPDFDRIVSSDLQRARHTAEIIWTEVAKRRDIPPVTSDPGLRERAAGPWSGLTRTEIEAGWPGMLESGERPEGFETDEDFRKRITPAIHAALCRPGRSLLVGHGGLIWNLEGWSEQRGRPRLDNLGGVFLDGGLDLISVGKRFYCSAIPASQAAIT